MKVLSSQNPTINKRRRKQRQRSKYIYCYTKHGYRIISRQKPRQPFKFIVCSVSTTDPNPASRIKDHSYDTDSFNIGIDNHASYCITNSLKDFIDTPKRVKVCVRGIKGNIKSLLQGTILWSVLDDDGVQHELRIPNSYYAPDIPIRLLSPQHLAQVLAPSETVDGGTICSTLQDRVELQWFNRQHKLTVLLNQANVAVFRSAPGYQQYQAFEASIQSKRHEPRAFTAFAAFTANVIPNDDIDDVDTIDKDDTATEVAPPPVSVLHRQDADSLSQQSNNQSGLRPDPIDPSSPSSPVIHGTKYHPNTANFNEPSLAAPPTTIPTTVNVVPYDDIEYTPQDPRQELLLWHYRLGHVPMSRLQHMAKRGDLPSRLATCQMPECAACRFGRATKIPWRVKGSQHQSHIKVCTQPGQCVSVDQLESTSPGFIAQLKGSLTRKRYRYVTVFTDHFSDLSYVHLQKTITSAETLEAKDAFEAYSKSLGVRIQHYHADNGRFADNLFLKSVKDNKQTISFCGVNAHFQNGIAEKRIRDLQEAGRSQLLHAKHRWPDAVDTSLWPYAIRYANDVHNSTTRIGRSQTPIEIFSSTSIRPKLKHFHPFACPVYVLQNKLQADQSIPKWESRSRIGLYLGPSPRHSRSVALVLNLATGLVSPQYHLRFDNYFETMQDKSNRPEVLWLHKAHFKGEDSETADEPTIVPPATPTKRSRNKKTPVPPNIPVPARVPESQEIQQQQQEQRSRSPVPPNEGDPFQPSPPSMDQHAPTAPPVQDSTPTLPPTQITRSGRIVKPTARSSESQQQRQAGIVAYHVEFEAIDPQLYQEEDKLSTMDDPIAFIAHAHDQPIAFKATNDPDTLYMHEALKAPDANEFKKAMVKEVVDQTQRKHWRVMLKKDVPQGETILPAVWSMKRKRRIATREVYKWKSRLNLGGHKMIYGKHYDETYAPALAWSTIRLFLILTIINNWKSRQIDFVLAYPQAPVPRPTYMELPQGIIFPGLDRKKHCLEILRNVYGGKDAGRTWYLYLKDGLEQLGFKQSQQDECVFYRGKTIFLVYTDDAIIIAPDDSEIDQCIADLSTLFSVDDQGTIEDYLGVQVTRLSNGSFKLSQPHLIDSILRDLGLLDANGQPMPNVKSLSTPSLLTKLIGPDPQGTPFDYTWHYRSIIGKLNFLEKSTRADISYPTHQCARFMESPKKSHGIAVKRIGRYLLDTRDKGLIIKPDKKHSFSSYVDADFCGNWDKRIAAEDPNTAKSRTGFIIKYANAPIFWQSKMQTQFALSSAESEYIALSTAARYIKSIMYLLEELCQQDIVVTTIPTIRCHMFEDNSAALEIARVPKIRPRTRHINSVLHHFRNEVANKRLLLSKVASEDNEADILTKSTRFDLFIKHRMAILGW